MVVLHELENEHHVSSVFSAHVMSTLLADEKHTLCDLTTTYQTPVSDREIHGRHFLII